MRIQMPRHVLEQGEFMGVIDQGADPFDMFETWFAAAKASEPNDPNAMTAVSVAEDGMPSARIVLLKGWDRGGFTFYTNLTSQKGVELLHTPKCALLFHWKSLERQVRIQGDVKQVSDDIADAYFATRPRDSQIGAWASDQSSALAARDDFEAAIAAAAQRFDGIDVPRPPHWSGLQVVPKVMEFWQAADFRLHDRVRFEPAGSGWAGQRLYP